MDEKLKSENLQKRAVFNVYIMFWEQPGQAGVENGAMLATYYSDILQNAPFRSQIFKKKQFHLRRQGGIDPPNQNPAAVPAHSKLGVGPRCISLI